MYAEDISDVLDIREKDYQRELARNETLAASAAWRARDEALRAFLSLPDVSVGTDDLMESFHEAFAGTYPNEEAALRRLSPLEEWETSLADWCIHNGIEPEALDWNHELLMARLRNIYDVVEGKEVLHVFIKKAPIDSAPRWFETRPWASSAST